MHPETIEKFNRAVDLYQLGDLQGTLQTLKEVIRLQPGFAQAWASKGEILVELGKKELALEAYEQAITLKPENAQTWYNKGVVLNDLGKKELALEAYEQAIILKPKYAEAWCNKATMLKDLGKKELALEAYEQAIILKPEDAQAWGGKGTVLHHLGKHELALKAYEQAITLKPELAQAWGNRGIVFKDLGHLIAAQTHFFRSYHFAHQQQLIEPVSVLLTHFPQTFSVPLFLHRIFQDPLFPSLHTSQRWASLIATTTEQCQPYTDLMAFIRSERYSSTPLEKLKLVGLIYYYLGDPLGAEEMFEAVSELDEADLMGQYYLIRSMEDYAEPTEGVWKFALQDAKTWLDEGEDVEQGYYAGHLFFEQKLYDKADQCFAKASPFLPALYMQAWVAEQQEDMARRDKLIQQALKREQELANPDYGFLKRIAPQDIDLNEPHWAKSFVKYAHSVEIQEAVWLVEEWQAPEFALSVKAEEKYGPLQALEILNFAASSKRLLFEFTESQRESQCFELSQQLHYAGIWPNFDTSLNTELQIGGWISQNLQQPDQHINALLMYHLLNRDITLPGFVLLQMYADFHRHRGKISDELLGNATTNALVGGVGAALSVSLAANSISLIVGTIIAGGLGTVMVDYLKKQLVASQTPIYGVFKERFLEFMRTHSVVKDHWLREMESFEAMEERALSERNDAGLAPNGKA